MTQPRLLLALFATSLVCCSNNEEATKVKTPAASPQLEAIFVERIAEEASPIHLARTTVRPGDRVILKGQVMGAAEPFVEGRAAFVIGDRAKLTPCHENETDGCATPWDNCCDSKEAFREGTATIQVLDEEGRLFKESIEGVGGLEKLAKVFVKGEVADQTTSGNLVVNANEIQIVR